MDVELSLDQNEDINFSLDSSPDSLSLGLSDSPDSLNFNNDDVVIAISGVTSVNGQTGAVTLDIPEKTSDIVNDGADGTSVYVEMDELANVALTGDYSSLLGKPTIPTKTSDLTNDSGYVTSASVPTKTSQLTNDSDFATNSGVSSAVSTHNSSNTAHADIRGDISTIEGLIPNQATTSNQLADKAFVNSSVQTATANFRGNWTDWADVPTVASSYPADYAGSTTPTVNDYLVVQDASDYTEETLVGTWRFKYTGDWSVDGKSGWQPEYQVNETPLTAAQLAALNSGITAALVANIPTVSNVVIELSIDMGTGTMVWSGADSVADVRSAYESGATITIVAPLLTDEVFKVTETWWGDQGNTKLWLQSIDNDLALLKIGISDDNSVDYTTVGIQGELTAGSNITISGNVISASGGTVDEHISDTSMNALANKAVYYAAIGGKLNVIIPSYSWNAGTDMSPYTHYFDLSYNNIPGIYVNNDSIIELINDNPVDFTKYGWAIYSVDTSTKKIRIISIGKPTGSTTLNMFIRGDYS